NLSGLRKVLPLTHVVMLLAGLSMGGVPLLNGILSKEMFFEGLLNANDLPQFNTLLMVIVVVIGVVASIFTFIYSLFMVKRVFWG
ncbi:proton-conducting transporter membrane subunit, partial [Staphylococcus epidermidis]|uniref:proton-conducting transporter transmembrane domain-containing protein n=1 Tax=Staphylococcus epidermidis TaxID=1282 RepID=UPI0030BB2704